MTERKLFPIFSSVFSESRKETKIVLYSSKHEAIDVQFFLSHLPRGVFSNFKTVETQSSHVRCVCVLF